MTVDACDLLCLDLPRAEDIRAGLPPLSGVERAAAAAKALGDPTRLTIASALAAGDELCVCDLAWVVGQARNLVSHHLRQLKTAGLARSRRDGKLVMHALTGDGRALVAAVLGQSGLVTVGNAEVGNPEVGAVEVDKAEVGRG